MTVETAVTIAQLDPERPRFDDKIVEGDDHIRLLKSVIRLDSVALSATAAQTLAGPLALPADPVQPLHAATKQYVDTTTRRRYVDVGAYCPLDDTQDAYDGVAAAFADGAGREIVFTNPFGGKRVYQMGTRRSRLLMPTQARIIWEPGTVMDFSTWGRSGTSVPYLYASGAYAPADTLAANAVAGSNVIWLAAGLSLAYNRGDYCQLVSDQLYTTEDAALGTYGEWVTVAQRTGNSLILSAPLRDTYTMAYNARVHRYTDPCRLQLENPQIIGAGRFTADVLGDRGIQILGGVNCEIRGGEVRYANSNGINFTNILGGTIDGVYVENEPKGTTNTQNQYPFVLVNGCEGTTITNCLAVGGKEGFALSASGGIQSVTRNPHFTNCIARGMWRSGFCSHDNHTAWQISNCVAEDCEQGFDTRIVDTVIEGCTARRMGRFGGSLDCGIQIGSGAGALRIKDFQAIDVLRGVYMGNGIAHETAPGNISMDGMVMRSVRGAGVLLDFNQAASGLPGTTTLGSVNIANMDMAGVTSATAPRGIEMHGKWDRPVITNTVLRGGNAGTSVFMHGTNNGGAGFGPISPVVDVAYETGYSAPVINHTTGVTKLSTITIGV